MYSLKYENWHSLLQCIYKNPSEEKNLGIFYVKLSHPYKKNPQSPAG
jgi:hypothetical protein